MLYPNPCFTVGLDGMGGSKITRCMALFFPFPLLNKSRVSLLALSLCHCKATREFSQNLGVNKSE